MSLYHFSSIASMELNLKYRPDIDGLRAVSVIAVVLYHYFPNYFGGGFVGVDIFFVISGYLVTSILVSSNKANQFSFISFYYRRIRRLLPSLIVVLLSTLIFGAIVLLSDEFQSLGLHTLAATFFSSNILLAHEAGYFDASVIYKPLLHLWSLSVEEQYYLVWPLIVWFALKFKKVRLGFVLWVLVGCSFLFNVIYINIDQTHVFYSLTSRIWELAFGGLLTCLNLDSLCNKKYYLNIFSVVGLLGILISIFSLQNNISYPGFVAALPVISAGLLISAGSETYLNKIISQKYFVYIGLISYPIYLWHWPLNSFAHVILSEQVSWLLKIALIFVTFLLSILTFEFLEKPIRQISISNYLVFKIAAAFLFIGGMGYGIWIFKGFPERYPAIESLLSSRIGLHNADNNSVITKECRSKFINTEMCVIADVTKEPTVVVIGDSHAASTYYGVNSYYTDKKENVLLLSRLATPPFLGVFVNHQGEKHDLEDVFHYITQSKSIHTVVLSAFWSAYYEKTNMRSLMADHKYWMHNKNNPAEKNQNHIFTNALTKTLKRLIGLKKNVVIVLNVPLIDFNIKSCLKRPLINSVSPCLITEDYARTRYNKYRNAIAEVVRQFPKDSVQIYDPVLYLCSQGACPLIRDNKLIYIDTNHLSAYGAEILFRNYK